MNMLKIKMFLVFLTLTFFVCNTFANGFGPPRNVAYVSPKQSCYIKHKVKKKMYGQGYARVIMYPGSLKANIKRIAHQYGWNNVVWGNGCGYDYRWVGRTKVVGVNFKEIMRKILINYPVQAVFYEGNHVLVINPRTLK